MATHSQSIMALLNQIRTDHQLVLPDIQRDFVWGPDQTRLLMDSIMRGYPFGSLLIWQTRYLEVAYREFVADYVPRQTFSTQLKSEGTPLRMVLDGQQRLQSLYLAVYGSYDHRRLYFNVTSGPNSKEDEDEQDDGLGASYRFGFWRDDEPKRPKRLVRVSEILGWAPRYEATQIRTTICEIGLDGEEADRAEANMRLLRQVMHQSDLVPAETIDEDAPDKASARRIDEVLEIFVRVNTGGTRLSKSDLMFSLLKSRWRGARLSFDELVAQVEKKARLGIDKDFIIRGLLTVADAPPSYEIENLENHWEKMTQVFDRFAVALRTAVDFVQSADVGIRSGSLLDPVATIFPVIYYLFHFSNGSVPDEQRKPLRSLIYFLLFNKFLQNPEARIRYLRNELAKSKGGPLPLDKLLAVVAAKQKNHFVQTTIEMVNARRRVTLNIAQPTVCRDTLSWQERAEVDHIFPQSVFRPQYAQLVDDIGNFAYLGKLQNIRKSKQNPWDYFADLSDKELMEDYLIDRALLKAGRFEDFVADRRNRITEHVKDFLGR